MTSEDMRANDGTIADESPRRGYVWVIIAIAVVVIFGLCLAPIGGWLVEAPFTLLFGWVPYAARAIGQIPSHGMSIALWAGGVSAFALGLHLAGRKFAADWQVRQTVSVVTLIFAATTAGICMIGVGHQASWLAHAPKLLEPEGRRHYEQRDSEVDLREIRYGMKTFAEGDAGALPRSTFTKHGRPLHGWMTMMLPQIGRMDLYDWLTLEGPWDMNYQDPVFDTEVSQYARFRSEVSRDERGFAVTHYSANSRVIDADNVKRLEDVADGLGNTILIGDINDQFPAWGRPRNGRDPAIGLNRPGGFGSPYDDGAQFVMGDGSVKHLSQNIDPEVLRALSTPQGNEPPAQYQDPKMP
ncbi:hypothetical protein C5Y93_21295 [Blastopirellula marina]|uniref:Uncharacterized protein n=2 Tax=Blastopirellula marina TaxID=124 RepID=A0A2S8GHZ6_9BACT|nr:hypothetical protein C5Y93_21295 [Blastopirellula marina]